MTIFSPRLLRTTAFSSSRAVLTLLIGGLLAACRPAAAQTMDDGIMLSHNKYCTGVMYTYDTWDHYWEGTNFRYNGNIGRVTTRTISYVGNYGIRDYLDVLFTVPHVASSSNSGVLHGQAGWQDFSAGLKWRALSVPVRSAGAVRAILEAGASIPMTHYTPDDLPLSIGIQSSTVNGRAMLNYLGKNGIYGYGSVNYIVRGNAKLSRPAYYNSASGQLVFSDEVAVPNQFQWTVSGGYRRNDMTLVATYTSQQTRGGGDIRTQDSPFINNRVNSSRIGGTATIPMPRMRDLQFWAIYSYVLDGRNLGQSNTATTGILYTFDFNRKNKERR